MGVPVAPGYPNYSGSIISPMFSMDLLELFYCTSIYGEISTTEYSGTLERCGDQLTFFRAPEVTVRDYEKGGELIHDTIDTEPVTLVVNQAKAFSLVVSQIDEKQICNWPSWREDFLKRAAYQLSKAIDTSLFSEIYIDVDPNNAGTSAGVISHSYNLGTTGSPVSVTSTNVNQVLTFLHGVLDEQCAPRENRYVVIPAVGYTTLLNSDLRAAYLTGMDISPLINGRLPPQVAGFNIYVSNFLPLVFDAGVSANCYQIIAGVKMATAFAAQIDQTRVIEDKDSFDRYYQGLAVYGFKVLYPKGVAALYARFS